MPYLFIVIYSGDPDSLGKNVRIPFSLCRPKQTERVEKLVVFPAGDKFVFKL